MKRCFPAVLIALLSSADLASYDCIAARTVRNAQKILPPFASFAPFAVRCLG